jgi:hypothetical protein
VVSWASQENRSLDVFDPNADTQHHNLEQEIGSTGLPGFFSSNHRLDVSELSGVINSGL